MADWRDGVPELNPNQVKPARERRPLHPVGLLGVAALVAGPLAWLWEGDWRWAVTGAGIALVLLTVGATLDSRRQSL